MTNAPDPRPTLDDLLPDADAPLINELFAYCRSAADELIAESTIELNRTRRIDEPLITHNDIARSISADQLESSSFATINDNPDIDPSLIFMLIELIIADRLNCASSDICADY